jgi:hypothetical protein
MRQPLKRISNLLKLIVANTRLHKIFLIKSEFEKERPIQKKAYYTDQLFLKIYLFIMGTIPT